MHGGPACPLSRNDHIDRRGPGGGRPAVPAKKMVPLWEVFTGLVSKLESAAFSPPPQNPCRRGLRRVVGTIAGEHIASEHIGSIYPDLGEGAGGVWSIPIPAGLAFYGSGKASVTSDLGYTAVGAQPRHQLG